MKGLDGPGEITRSRRKVDMKWHWRVARNVALGGVFFALACGGGGEAAPEAPEAPPQPYLNATPGPAQPTGVVVETMDAGGYTYARVEADGTELWLAGPLSQVTLGDTLSLVGADNMGQFSSPSLDRTFDELYFVQGFKEASDDDGSFQGTVTETMNVAGYTYAQVEVAEELAWMTAADAEEPIVWLAGPEMELSVGDVVSWRGGSVMRDFHSGTLGRTFSEIVFVGSMTRVE